MLSVSQFTANLTNEIFGIQKKFTIISNAIDTNSFVASNSKNENTILYFGSLIRKKGLLELPFIFNEVIRKNPLAQLILVGKDVPDIITGNNSTWEMMRKLFTEEASSNVTYLGSVPYPEINRHIAAATVCVFPTFAEALPLSWLEAMAMQKAIVASNIGWAAEVIDDGVNGFLVNPNNHMEYSSKINTLLINSKLCQEFGIAARKKVTEKFSISVVAKQNLDFYLDFQSNL